MLKNILSEYLEGYVDIETIQQQCRITYKKYLTDCNLQFNLEAIKCLPFIHEIAYSTYTEDINIIIKDYLNILSHKKTYSYSCFMKLPEEIIDVTNIEQTNYGIFIAILKINANNRGETNHSNPADRWNRWQSEWNPVADPQDELSTSVKWTYTSTTFSQLDSSQDCKAVGRDT